MEKYGFVYIWYDSLKKRYYIGSHWGHVDDGYICSSKSMREAYRKRKEKFKRRILCYVYTDREGLLEEEQRYLDKIDRKHFGRKYYNVNASVKNNSWWVNEETTKIVSEKISKSYNGKNSLPENRKKNSDGLKLAYAEGRKKSWNKGFTKETNESVLKISMNNIGKNSWNKGLTKETDERIKAPKTAFKKGQEGPKTKWKKGNVPWNKGKKGVMRIPWNKGLTKETDERIKAPKTAFKKGDIS